MPKTCESRMPQPEPAVIAGEPLYQCPVCGCVGTVDDFDCLGAEDGELICRKCGEFGAFFVAAERRLVPNRPGRRKVRPARDDMPLFAAEEKSP